MIKYSKSYDLNFRTNSNITINRCNLEDFENFEYMVKNPWEISVDDVWLAETDKDIIQTFCFVSLKGIEKIDYKTITSIAEYKLDRKVLAYVADKMDVYASAYRRLEEIIYGY